MPRTSVEVKSEECRRLTSRSRYARSRAWGLCAMTLFGSLSCGRPVFVGPLGTLAAAWFPRGMKLNCRGFSNDACWSRSGDTLRYFELDERGAVGLVAEQFSPPAQEGIARMKELRDSLSRALGAPLVCAGTLVDGGFQHMRWVRDSIGISEIGFWPDLEKGRRLTIRLVHALGSTRCDEKYSPPFAM